MPVLSWINSNLTTNPNHMSKVSAQNGNWNKVKYRWDLFFLMLFCVYLCSASVNEQIQSYIQEGLGFPSPFFFVFRYKIVLHKVVQLLSHL